MDRGFRAAILALGLVSGHISRRKGEARMKRGNRSHHRIVWSAIALTGMILAATIAVAGMKGASLPKDFRSWTHTKSMVIPDKSHGLYGFHNIYANDKALPTLKKGGTYKEGSSFVVSFYDVVVDGGATVQGKKLQDVLMIKDKGATKTGGWSYSAFGADGKALDIDSVKACYECHEQGAKKTDYIFSKYID